MIRPHLAIGGRYPVLRTIAILYLVLGGLVILGGLATTVWALTAAPWDMLNRIGLALLTLSATFFLALTTIAVAEGIKLAIDIELNTRVAAMRDLGPGDEPKRDVVGGRLGGLREETAEEALIKGH